MENSGYLDVIHLTLIDEELMSPNPNLVPCVCKCKVMDIGSPKTNSRKQFFRLKLREKKLNHLSIFKVTSLRLVNSTSC